MDRRLEGKKRAVQQMFLTNAVYLEDEPVVAAGLTIWGSPWTPRFCGSFQLKDKVDARAAWAKIPQAGVDILVTHGPPHGILYEAGKGQHVGCAELRRRVEKVRPRVHAFGHIQGTWSPASMACQDLGGWKGMGRGAVTWRRYLDRPLLVPWSAATVLCLSAASF